MHETHLEKYIRNYIFEWLLQKRETWGQRWEKHTLLKFVQSAHINYSRNRQTWRTGGLKNELEDFPSGTVVKNPPANAVDTGSSPGPGKSHMPRSN